MNKYIVPGSKFHKLGPTRITIGRGNDRKSIVPDFRSEQAREDFKNYVARPRLFAAQHGRVT